MPNLDRSGPLSQAPAVGAAGSPGRPIAEGGPGRPRLDDARSRLLAAVADTILPRTDTPGAVEAGVPQLVDSMLGTWASPQRRIEIVEALDRIDALARDAHRKPFADLDPDQRETVLTPHDVAALAPVAEPPSAASQSIADRAAPRFADPGYGKLKELIVVGYYCSELALTSELSYELNPGAWEPSFPVTPETRPWGGEAFI